MKFSQLIEYFSSNNAENEAGRLIRDLFLFLKKALNEVKVKGLQFNFHIF